MNKRIILLGRKKGSIDAIKYLISKNIEIPIVVLEKQLINNNIDYFKKHRIIAIDNDEEIYELIRNNDIKLKKIDFIISYLFWKKIREPLIRVPRYGCINFHPAPLPDYKNRAGYNTAILNSRETYGVTAHYIDSEELDSGPIILSNTFRIDPIFENAYSLEKKTQVYLLKLFKNTIRLVYSSKKIITSPNIGGLCLTRSDLEKLKKITKKDIADKEILDRKIRAFFYPPYSGAEIEIGNSSYTVVNNKILEYISDLLDEKI